MPGRFRGRIITAILANRIHAGDIQRQHLPGNGRTDMTLQKNKFTIQPFSHPPGQLQGGDFQQMCQSPQLFCRGSGTTGIDPYGIHRRTDCQRLTMAVGNDPSMGRNIDHAHMPCLALIAQRCIVDYLEVDRPPYQDSRHCRKQRKHQYSAPVLRQEIHVRHGLT